MCQPKKWWWGLIPLALLWLLAGSFKTGPIQQDLTTRATAALSSAGLGWGKVAMAGRDAQLGGEAFDAAQRPTAATVTDDTRGVRLVRDGTTVMPETRPFAWSAARDGGKLTLGGLVPSEAARKQIIDDARKAVPSAEIVDQMRLARGAAPVFAAATAYGLTQIGRLPDGKANLSDSTLTVTGTAPSLDVYSVAAAAGLPQGVSGSVQIGAPVVRPYQWQAQRAAGAVTLTGLVPNEETRAQITAAARQAIPGATVADQMRVAAGAPTGLGGMAVAGLGHLRSLGSGISSLVDTNYTITGAAETPDSYAAVIQASRSLPQGFTLARADIAPPTVRPYLWQAQRAADAVTLTGLVPNDQTRAQIAAAARQAVPGATVTDRMQIAAGAPAGLDALATAALGQLGRLSSGIADLVGTNYSITGVARTPENHAAVLQSSRSLPQGFSLARADVTPPTVSPYVWGAEKAGSAITLTGFVPSEQVRGTINEAARASAAGVTVTDRMQIAAGAPAGFDALARFGLGQLGKLTNGTVGASNLALSLTGTAPTPQAFSDVSTALRTGLPQGVTLAASNVAPPTVSPYVWGAEKAGNAITLTGFVPSEQARGTINDAARASAPGVTVTDRMLTAAGAPAGFEALARFAVGQLGRLNSGVAGLADRALSLTGSAPTPEVFNDVMASLRNALPAGATLARSEVAPPVVSPYTWSATRNRDAVTLAGHVPSQASRAAVVAAVQQAIPAARITDNQVVASGQPNNFDAMTAYGVRQLGRLNAGTASLAANAYTIVGEAPSQAIRSELVAALTALPAGFTLAREAITAPVPPPPPPPPTVSVPTPEAPAVSVPVPEAPVAAVVRIAPAVSPTDPCQAAMNDILKEPILFAVNRAEIDARSYLVLNRLALAAEACPSRMIEIGAHTDSDGQDEANMELSRRRAEAVVDFLIRDGVERRRLIATGFGRMQPVAPNDTPENKARNRRVEFVVLDREPPPPTPADVCQVRFRELLREPVLFAVASSEIDARSYPLLGRLAETAQTCAEARIEIGAHTDSDGAPDRNLALSQRRAASVVEYLVSEGIDRDRLQPTGFGQTRPVAPNDTAENKARNRRVEFFVK